MHSKSLRPSSLPHSKKIDNRRQASGISFSRHYQTEESVLLRGQPRSNDGNKEHKKCHVLTEHRRTQMRQAQRKYRFRKDATISVLQQRNAELESALSVLKSIAKLFQGQIAALENMQGGFMVIERLRDTTIQFLAEIEKSERSDSRPLWEQNYRIHSPMWQMSMKEHDTPRPVPALGYEMLTHERIEAL
ncbi:hypothetical protein N7508_002338 [Penicillium antarcticum]|uniref:uncharacterized protein n=1 Tax=Penicillium antarcticum TaxID=416450 RepID=UPI00238DF2A3|nr:uncharacterized protein N7508_002338 [Penicillium antarcticum]KAJ5317830.1 hypothetical protein N7508_002338 [Penicillium antarcticum]